MLKLIAAAVTRSAKREPLTAGSQAEPGAGRRLTTARTPRAGRRLTTARTPGVRHPLTATGAAPGHPAERTPLIARTAGVKRRLIAAGTAALVAGVVAGSVPAGPASAHRGSCTPGLLFCEDFDRLPAGGPATLRWGVDTRNGTLTVERARHSNKVLHVHTVDNGRAFLRIDDFAAPGNRFFGRMRLRVDAFPTAPDWAHFTLVEATGTGSSEVVRPIGGQYAPTVPGIFWGVGADGGPTGDWTNWHESAPVTEDAWQCFEWSLDSSGNRVTVWIDGVANPELTASTTDHGGADVPFILPTVDTVKIGWQLYQPNTTPAAFDLWIDDIALSTNRLGC